MKVLIWIACLIGASTVEVFLGYVGIVGLIPTLAVYGGMFAAARYLCAKYEEERNGGSTPDPVSSEESDGSSVADPVSSEELDGSSAAHGEEERENVEGAFLPPITYCRKCGEKLVEDSDFCSFCGAAVVKE